MTKLEKGMIVVEAVKAPTGSLASIIYEGQGQGSEYGRTLFHIFMDDMSYGVFAVRGNITTLEDAQAKLKAPKRANADESLAEYAVCYHWIHIDDNEHFSLE
ncbi:hypothetical protein SPSIL_015650 [Sporomusa silvacetica DSM 10669]|uniref:Uncharacterized protein n=1 Tax=Sporomusa silvacetica DSM 10669 TaxID=1123289 RepID=A0ABZ3IIC9_9FIRM|nr:hypothetical protein [Sporomusa silvacetica]OZC22100.1 hypothetical protein SPSIL_06820 [Sporomusa silvacetica DSM 10669]